MEYGVDLVTETHCLPFKGLAFTAGTDVTIGFGHIAPASFERYQFSTGIFEVNDLEIWRRIGHCYSFGIDSQTYISGPGLQKGFNHPSTIFFVAGLIECGNYSVFHRDI